MNPNDSQTAMHSAEGVADPTGDSSSGIAFQWFSPIRFAGILAILIVAMYPDVVFLGKSFFFRDFCLFGYPLASFQRDCFWRGEFPLWNPLSACGVPYLAQWNTLTLYPLSLIYLLIPLPWSLGFFCLLHQFIAGMGMYFLARRWTSNALAASVAGIAFAFNGLTMNCLMWPNNIAALGWMPWVLYAMERGWREGGRWIILGVLAAGMQFMTGAPEIVMFTGMICGGCWALDVVFDSESRMARIRRMGWMALGAAGLCAVQWMPFMDLLTQSQRAPGYSKVQWPMPPSGWANLLLPLFYTHSSFHNTVSQTGQYWTSSYYPGAVALLLGIKSALVCKTRKVWFLFAVVLCGMILALGEDGFLYSVIKDIPPFTMMRYPVKFTVLILFALPLLAAMMIGRDLTAREPISQAGDRRLNLVLYLAFSLLIAALYGFATYYPYSVDDLPAFNWNTLVRWLLLSLTLAVLWSFKRVSTAKGHVLGGILLLTLIWLDLATHEPRQNPTVSGWVYEKGLVDKYLPDNPRPVYGQSRAMISYHAFDVLNHAVIDDPLKYCPSRRSALMSNCNLIDEIPKVDGFYSLYSAPMYDLQTMLYASPQSPPPEGLLDFMGVSHITTPEKLFDWSLRTNYMPMIAIGQAPKHIAEASLPTEYERFNPRETVLLPISIQRYITAVRSPTARVTTKMIRPERLEMETDTPVPTLLTVAQARYKRWEARVDGQQVNIWRANGAFQAVNIPAGRHSVTFVYRDTPFRVGAVISTLTILVLAGCALVLRRTKAH